MQAIIAFVQANTPVLALALYGVLDLAVLLSPKIAANGIVHLILSWAAAKAGVSLPGEQPPAK